jgi:DNA (cytosine-5)-methyltransferase 1
MTTVGQVEIDLYCRRVLARHWPDVPRHDDVRTVVPWWQSTDRPRVDLICMGFPCQPFSNAGFMKGIADERWAWPWGEAAIRALRPRYVLVENVSALVRDDRAFGTVLRDLHTLGFDAEWATLRASDYGAPHNRERVYLLAHAARVDGQPRDRMVESRVGGAPFATGGLPRMDAHQRRRAARDWLAREPRVDRLVDGVPAQMDRLRVAGNAVVPAIPEFIGRRLMEATHA